MHCFEEIKAAQLIARPKLGGGGNHVGLAVTWGWPSWHPPRGVLQGFDRTVVYDFSQDGLRVLSPEEFAQGRQVRVLEESTEPRVLDGVLQRLDELRDNELPMGCLPRTASILRGGSTPAGR